MSNGIMIERPEGMTYELYKELRKRQNRNTDKYKKGKIVVLKTYKKKSK